MADVADGSLASWIQAGGVVAFATAVLVELRGIRPTLTGIKEVLAALLERERIRNDRRRDSSGPHNRPTVQTPKPPVWSDGETTDLHQLIEMQRRGKPHTPAHGVRQSRPGSHADRPFDNDE